MGLRQCIFRQKPDETQSTSDSIFQSIIPTDLLVADDEEEVGVITILRTDIFPVADEVPDEVLDEVIITILVHLIMFLEVPDEP